MSAEAQPLPGGIDASGVRVGVVRATFNAEITDGLLAGARRVCDEAGVAELRVVDAPGAFELPLLAQQLARSGYDAVVALGAVVEGETDHYEHVAHRASEGLMRVMLDTGVPVAFGVLTVRRREHAVARSLPGAANKGAEAAAAALRAAVALAELRAR